MRVSDSVLERLLLEDAPHGDLTTGALKIGDRPGRAFLTVRDPMVVACVEEAERLFQLVGCQTRLSAHSGDRLEAGAGLLMAEGRAEALHLAWKQAQTLIEYCSGIATAAAALVDSARAINPDIAIACTRKTFPGTRAFAARAVRAGGASLHRLGLSETLLVFPEHRAFAPDETLTEQIARLRRAAPEKKVVVEVNSLGEALLAVEAACDVLQLEKFTPEEVARTVAALETCIRRPLVAAAGGVKAANAAAYAQAGADILVTSSPYQAPPRDVQVRLLPI